VKALSGQQRKDKPDPGLVLCLMGPTASGKTGLAVELVERYPVEIVSVDSALVYRGMDVGTAKPGPDVLARAPHRLIDIVDPAEAYSAARFRDDALEEIRAIRARQRIPLLVGGTMLYFRALMQGLSALPPADPAVREHLLAQARELGWDALHQRLRAVDPVAAARIHANDTQRVQRALEVHAVTGRSMTSHLSSRDRPDIPWRYICWGLFLPSREQLHARIEARFHGMLEDGLVAEVAGLRGRGDLDLNQPSMRAVGYRQVWDYLDGRLSHEQMTERGIFASRQLAKRQLTWLRSEPDLEWFDATQSGLVGRICARMDQLMDGYQ